MTPSTPKAGHGPLAPLAVPIFLALFTASTVSSFGGWMQDVARVSVMTALAPTPIVLALLQAVAMLAMVLVVLPAGVAADLLDRRRLLVLSQLWMVAVALASAALVATGAVTPGLLLLLTFLGACGAAVAGPAFQAALPEMVGEEDLAQANLLNGLSFNVARAVGPALGGLAVAAVGPAAVFLLNAGAALGVVAVYALWQPRALPPSSVPREHAWEAFSAGLRYARASPSLRDVLARTALFAVPASALWALLPLVARSVPGSGPGTYGLLLAAVGAGSLLAGLSMPTIRRRVDEHVLLLAAAGLVAMGLIGVGAGGRVVWPALVLAGLGWMIALVTLMTATQSASPRWVRGRAASLFILCFGAAMALGSLLWGALAEWVDIPTAFLAAGVAAVAGGLLSTRLSMPPADARAARIEAPSWPMPSVADGLDPERGPVLIHVTYQVRPGQEQALLALLARLAPSRRASGTLRWSVYAHGLRPGVFLETNVVTTWGEHLRQRERQTAEARELETALRQILEPGTSPEVVHWIAPERPNLVSASHLPVH